MKRQNETMKRQNETVLTTSDTTITFFQKFMKNLPLVIEFKDLHITNNFKQAKAALKNRMGIYCIICLITGKAYVGSSKNLAERLNDHIIEGKSNKPLQNAITKHGLEHFIFYVVELVELDSGLRPESL